MTYRKFLEILLWLVKGITLGLALFVFLWLFNKYFSPFGKLAIAYDFSEDSQFISHLDPWQRLSPIEELNGDFFQRMKDDLIYFWVKTPRWFQKANVEITFQNPDQPILELGAKVNVEEGYLDQPLQNKIIDGLTWAKIQEGDVLFFQKEKKYVTIQDFVSRVPKDKKTGVYFYNLPQDRIIPEYRKSSQKTVIDRTLRGSFTIFTYLKDENLDFNFTKVDLNRYQGQDNVIIEVYEQKTGKKIYSGEIPDDGQEGITGILATEQNFSFSIPNLEEGVYRIELKGNDDFLTTKIVTGQHLVIFSRVLFLADNEEYFKNLSPGNKPTNLFTNASKIKIKTSHPTGLQEIIAGNQKLSLQEINKDYEFTLSGMTKLTIPKNDVSLESDGFFAFSEKQYFNPYPPHIVTLRGGVNIDELDYVIARYTPPQNQNEWMINSQAFELAKLYRNQEGRYRFRLSAPGLRERGSDIAISKIKITFEKPPFTWQNFFPRLKNYLLRKINKI